MTLPFQDRANVLQALAEAEALIDDAALRSPVEIPVALARVIALVEGIRADIRTAPLSERPGLLMQLKQFQTKLSTFSSVMRRSENIFQGYRRRVGASLSEYSPAGIAAGVRDPAFLNLSV